MTAGGLACGQRSHTRNLIFFKWPTEFAESLATHHGLAPRRFRHVQYLSQYSPKELIGLVATVCGILFLVITVVSAWASVRRAELKAPGRAGDGLQASDDRARHVG